MFKVIPESYLFYKGGGGGGMIAYMMQQQAAQAEENRRREDAKEEKAAKEAEERAAQEKADKETAKQNWQTKVGSAYDSAVRYGKQKNSNLGLTDDNDYGIMATYLAALDRAKSGAPDTGDDANSLFSTTLYDDAVSEARTNQRNKYGREVKNTFGDDYGTQSFADTADDAILQALLDSQKSDTITALDRALARGTINEVGRSAADKELENMLKSGMGKANSMGMNVLNDYRGRINDRVGKSRTRASEWDFGDTYDINSESSGINSYRDSLYSSLEGDILNAIGSTDFFDDDVLLGKAGNASGIGNGGNGLVQTNAGGSSSLTQTSGVTDRTKNKSGERKTTTADEVF